MSQAEGPEAQVRRRVGDAAQAELNGVDGLVQEHVCKVKLQRRGGSDGLPDGGGGASRAASLTCLGAASLLAASSSPSSSSSS